MRWFAIFVLVSVAGCGRASPPPPREGDPGLADASAVPQSPVLFEPDAAEPKELAVDAAAPVDLGPKGVVLGSVQLAKGHKVPLAPPPLVNGLPATAVAPCPPIDLHDQRSVTRADGGGLSPVHVAITGMRTTPPSTPRTHELFIDGCRLRPSMLAATRGDSVRITNRTDTALLPLLPGDRFMQGMMRGESRELSLKQLGRSVIRCNFANYCGETVVVTVSHPLYAITDGEGRFRIENVPLDQPLKVHAFHPLFDVATVEVTLTSKVRERTIALTLTPKPASALAPAKQPEQATPKPTQVPAARRRAQE